MVSEHAGFYSEETHEQFVQRASRVFPEHSVRSWSRIERGVFNTLMERLIHRHSYAAITDAMLQQCQNDMAVVVRRFGSN